MIIIGNTSKKKKEEKKGKKLGSLFYKWLRATSVLTRYYLSASQRNDRRGKKEKKKRRGKIFAEEFNEEISIWRAIRPCVLEKNTIDSGIMLKY